jgi:hypothetical protein
MKIEYFPKSLSNHKFRTMCPFCFNNLNIYDQFIYTKKFKDECKCCTEQPNETMYCLCNNECFYEKYKIIYCNYCYDNEDKKESIYDHKCINISYKDLYKLARSKNIKNRSIMSKEELYNAVHQYCTL